MYWQEFLTIALIHLVAVMSPGPDFAMVTKNALVYSRKTGIYSAIGLGMGISIHVIYSLVGIGLIISQSIIAFTVIKWLGALYLIYIGFQLLRSKRKNASDSENMARALSETQNDLTPFQAIKTGFLTNVLNPKATLFFLSLFTQVIDPATPLGIQALYGIEMSVMTFVWFAFVALVLSNPFIKRRFMNIQHYVEKFFGLALVGLGIKVALSSKE